jgi:group I intron endonuclease
MKLPKYHNIDTEKLQILSDNLGKSGIYCFTNTINGKRYVGSSNNLRIRLLQYFNTNYLLRNTSMPICRALLNHGYSNFSLEILEFCKSEYLLIREKHFIDLLKPAYNISQDPSAPMSGLTHSDETRKKMSDTHKKIDNSVKFKTGEDNPMFGKTGKDHPMFGKPRASGAGSAPQKIEVFDQKTNLTTTFDSISEAAKALSISSSSIRSYFCKNQQKPYKDRYIFKKVG